MDNTTTLAVGPDEVGLEKLRTVVQAIHDENYPQVAVLCQTLLEEERHECVVRDLKKELQEALLVAWLHCERYDDVIATDTNIANDTNASSGNITSSSTGSSSGSSIRAIQCYALYKQKQYHTLVQQQQPDTHDTFFMHLRAQSWHHLSDGPRAVQLYMDQLDVVNGSGGNVTNDNDTIDDETVQLWTNLLAVWMAHHTTPYCSTNSTLITTGTGSDSLIQRQQQQLMIQSMVRYIHTIPKDSESYPYDLVYNLATLELLTTATTAKARGPWLELLDTAVTACRNVTTSMSTTLNELEQAIELEPLTMHQALFRTSFWQGTYSMAGMGADSKQRTNLPAALAMVQRMNRALTLSSPTDALAAIQSNNIAALDVTLLTSLQRSIWYYNVAVLQFQAARYDDCQATCQTHFLTSKHTKNGKKKKTKDDASTSSNTITYGPKYDPLFWECRAIVLLAYCASKKEGHTNSSGDGGGGGGTTVDAAAAALEACVEQLRAAPSSTCRDHCLVYTLTHQAAWKQQQQPASVQNNHTWKLQLLDSLPESVAEKPAVLATKAALYELTGNSAKAAQIIKRTDGGVSDDLAVADFTMSQGNYLEAAELYEQYLKRSGVKDEASVTARWVRALSYFDPAKAIQVWSVTSPELVTEPNGEEINNGADLETRELRWKKSSGGRKKSDDDPTLLDNAVGSNKTRKSHESVMRRRARQRDAYLAKQNEQGISTASLPDPERWVPKYERSNARRRKNRQHTGGGGGGSGGAHQGGVSEKEAAKLDIVARQAARAAGEDASTGRSTAHLTVSGSRKGGKASKRR